MVSTFGCITTFQSSSNPRNNLMQQSLHFEGLVIKSATNDHVSLSGYASVFNNVDSHNDIMMPGAFTSNLSSQKTVKFLWQHDPTKPIGIVTTMHEDGYGLYAEVTINSSTQQGREAIALVKQGAIDGLSIGFNVKDFEYNNAGLREIKSADLWEISLVTFPSNHEAQVTRIKQMSVNNTQQTKEIAMNIEQIESKLDSKIEDLETKFTTLQSAVYRPDPSAIFSIENKSFTNYLRKGDVSGLETKSFSSSEEEGGVLLIPALYNRIITGIAALSPMRRLASVETISTNALDVIIEDGKFDSGWVADGAARDETGTPKLKSKRINVHELYAQPKATQRLLDDSAINLESWLNEKLQDSFVRTENKSFFQGDGNNQPVGILHYSEDNIERVKVGEAGKLNPEDLLNLINSLDESYLANASLVMHRSTLCEIQKLQDENGRFIWQPAISDAQPQTLFGLPVVCSGDMPIFKEGNLAIALGDFKAAYKIVDRSGIAMMRDPYTEKPFVKFYAVKRVGGDLINGNALKFLKM